LLIILYSLSAYLLIALGRSIVSLTQNYTFIDALTIFVVGDIFSIVIGIVIVVIIYYQRTILVDIDTYLHELREGID
jgi:hypothetical protein